MGLIYLDECEAYLQPALTRICTLRGAHAVVTATGSNERFCLYGAVNYKTGHVNYMSQPKKNSRTSNQFVYQCLSANVDGFLVLVLDTAAYHRIAGVLDILAEHEHHVSVVWLPKYSCELNAIKRLRGYFEKLHPKCPLPW